jgi:hypothetical protein
MRVYFSTVIRTADPLRGGSLVSVDWAAKRSIGIAPVVPHDPDLVDPNPRGNTRGGRGIVFCGDEVAVASYHTLRFYDRSLRHTRDITHPLFAGIHELADAGDGSVWVAATAVDAALRVDMTSGRLLDQRWPREMPGLQAALGVEPLAIDKSADNRARFLDPELMHGPGRLHLNALAVDAGRLLALLHTPGVIADLDAGTVVVRDGALRNGHNLVVREDGVAIVNETMRGTVRFYDLRSGKLVRTLRLRDHRWVRDHIRRHALVHGLRTRFARLGLVGRPPARPLFVRGLDRHAGRVFVGISPAAIVEIDEESGRLEGAFRHSADVRQAVHGLRVERPPAIEAPRAARPDECDVAPSRVHGTE